MIDYSQMEMIKNGDVYTNFYLQILGKAKEDEEKCVQILENMRNQKNRDFSVSEYLNEYETIKLCVDCFGYRRQRLEKLSHLPMYRSVLKMTEDEIRQFQEEKIRSLESFIRDMKNEVKQYQEKKNLLYNQKQYMSRRYEMEDTPFSLQEWEDIEKAFEAQDILIQKANHQIQSAQIEIKKWINPFIKDIRNMILQELGLQEMKGIIQREKVECTNDYDIFALQNLMGDLQKMRDFTRLSSSYVDGLEFERQMGIPLNLSLNLPSILHARLHTCLSSTNGNVTLHNVEKVKDIVKTFKQSFEKQKVKMEEEFTLSKMEELFEVYPDDSLLFITDASQIDPSAIDIRFIQMHADKVSRERLWQLEKSKQELVQIDKKVVVTGKVKKRRRRIEETIVENGMILYHEIMAWYLWYGENGMVTNGTSSYNPFQIKPDIPDIVYYIREIRNRLFVAQKAIRELEENLQIIEKTLIEKSRENKIYLLEIREKASQLFMGADKVPLHQNGRAFTLVDMINEVRRLEEGQLMQVSTFVAPHYTLPCSCSLIKKKI